MPSDTCRSYVQRGQLLAEAIALVHALGHLAAPDREGPSGDGNMLRDPPSDGVGLPDDPIAFRLGEEAFSGDGPPVSFRTGEPLGNMHFIGGLRRPRCSQPCTGASTRSRCADLYPSRYGIHALAHREGDIPGRRATGSPQ